MTALKAVIARWRGEIPLYAYAALCGAACVALMAARGVVYDPTQTWLSFRIFYTTAAIYFLLDICFRLVRDRPQHPLEWARDRYFSVRSMQLLLGALPALALCFSMIPLFSSMKSMIPLFTDYTWDATFIAWDRALFLGHDPWKVMQPVLGYPLITALIAAAYHAWVGFLYPGTIVMALLPSIPDDLRRRFFLSYALAWSVVGGLLATMLASVGPVFAQPLVGIDTFAAQIEYLRSANEVVPVMTLSVQDMLLERFHEDARGLGSGITAMPSMHVAISVLFWLAAREVSPKAGRILFWFMVLIWVGSVHLAYHYALDGLVSLVAMAAIWKAVPFVFRVWDRLALAQGQPALRTNTVPAE